MKKMRLGSCGIPFDTREKKVSANRTDHDIMREQRDLILKAERQVSEALRNGPVNGHQYLDMAHFYLMKALELPVMPQSAPEVSN